MQNFSTQFTKSYGLAIADFKNYKVADLRLRTSRIRKLRTCGADFKYYEVTDLRLWTLRITKLQTCGCGLQESGSCGLAVADSRILKRRCGLAVADLRLRTKLLNVQLRTCGCGLRKLKFGCGFADCRLKKKLVVSSTGFKEVYLAE